MSLNKSIAVGVTSDVFEVSRNAQGIVLELVPNVAYTTATTLPVLLPDSFVATVQVQGRDGKSFDSCQSFKVRHLAEFASNVGESGHISIRPLSAKIVILFNQENGIELGVDDRMKVTLSGIPALTAINVFTVEIPLDQPDIYRYEKLTKGNAEYLAIQRTPGAKFLLLVAGTYSKLRMNLPGGKVVEMTPTEVEMHTTQDNDATVLFKADSGIITPLHGSTSELSIFAFGLVDRFEVFLNSSSAEVYTVTEVSL